MAKRPSKHLRPARPLSSGHAYAETKSDGRWAVRSVAGDRALKPYTCPGCLQTIPVGMPHVVAWPSESTGLVWESPVSMRRHWHSGCWRRKR